MAGASPVQTQEDLVPPPPAAIGYRLAGVLLAPAVAATLHVILVGPFGIDVQVPESPGSTTLVSLPLLQTTVVTLVVALAGWLSVMALERFLGPEQGRRIWTFAAFAVFVLSLAPILPLDVPVEGKWALFVLHLGVAVVLIPTLFNGQAAEPLHRDT
ncbi:DUF6069 family protein [Euzebya tangerina]|uniref:DUF6069 family protein n=1 Tax=Euzebya tangerina TaxID=591198 RepID=UPI000E315118|nr:DUF6069 family protein [Euzebya tangerina]